MKTIIKIAASVIILVALLVTITVIVLVKTVNPNDFKNSIDNYLYQKTGRHLTINGKISWSFIPWIGIELQQVSIGNPANFQGPNLADIGTLEVKVRFWPLLTGNLQIGKIIVKNAKINLIKTATENNWGTWQSTTVPLTLKQTEKNENATEKQKSKFGSFNLGDVAIINSEINIINKANGVITSFREFNFSLSPKGKNQQLQLDTNFLLAFNNTSMTIPTDINALITFNSEQQIISSNSFHLKATIVRAKLPSIPFNISSYVMADIDKKNLELRPMLLSIANLQTAGKVLISDFTETPSINAQFATSSVQLEPFIKTIRGKSFVKGDLVLKTQLTTRGSSSQQILQNLNGVLSIRVSNGAILGFNMSKLLAQGSAIINQHPIDQTKNQADETPFSNLSATANIKNGLLSNNDLSLQANEISATGKGLINLADQTINYRLTAQYLQSQNTNQTPFLLPINITGSLSSPSIKPDLGPIARRMLENTLKKKIEDYTGKAGKKFNLDQFFH